MYLGNFVEIADKESLYVNPLHPYTQALLSAVPIPDPTIKRERIILQGNIPSPLNAPKGCKFHTRCPKCMDICAEIPPAKKQVDKNHCVYCHLCDKIASHCAERNNDMILLKNVRPYDKSADVQDILICGRDIIEIAPNIDVPERLIEQTIDGEGLVAAPGYIDQHVHITGGGGEGGFSNQVPPLKLSQLVDAGVTTVVGLLGTDGTTRSVANLVAKTKAFNEEGWTAYCLTGSYWYPTHTLTGSVIDDITFIQEIIGVKVAISDHRGSGITKDELTRLATRRAWAACFPARRA